MWASIIYKFFTSKFGKPNLVLYLLLEKTNALFCVYHKVAKVGHEIVKWGLLKIAYVKAHQVAHNFVKQMMNGKN